MFRRRPSPNRDSLLKHIERVNQQPLAWNQCLSCELQLPPPAGNGWKLSDGQLEIVWSTIPSAPDSHIEYIHCKCKTGCGTKRCSCLKAGLGCTALCGCENCKNEKTENFDEDVLPVSDSSDVEQDCEDDDDVFEE